VDEPSTERDSANRPSPLEPAVPWILTNLVRLTIYLAIASLVSGAVFAISDEPDRLVQTILGNFLLLFLSGGSLCLPGLGIWLLILASLLPRSPRARQRPLAVATAPLIGAFWLIFFLSGDLYLHALVFGVLWPLGAGFVVLLRGHAEPKD
jgi:hypothetical protein